MCGCECSACHHGDVRLKNDVRVMAELERLYQWQEVARHQYQSILPSTVSVCSTKNHRLDSLLLSIGMVTFSSGLWFSPRFVLRGEPDQWSSLRSGMASDFENQFKWVRTRTGPMRMSKLHVVNKLQVDTIVSNSIIFGLNLATKRVRTRSRGSRGAC